MTTFTGTHNNDTLSGTGGHDLFKLQQGGDDTATGDGGKDTFVLGATLTAADQLDGGAGNDTLTLSGNYSAGLVFGASTITSIETLRLLGNHDYNLTTDDANVAGGQTLKVDASALGAGNILTFDGAAELNGKFTVTGGAGDDIITGGHKNDTFTLSHGGNDTAYGGAGNDMFSLGATFTAADHISGGSGSDTMTLNGDYTGVHAVVFGATTMTTVEKLNLAAGHSYDLTTNNATVASGHTLTIDASALGAGDSLTFNGAAETNGTFHITGGAGSDAFHMGATFTAADTIEGGPGAGVFDNLYLDGDYSAGLTFGAATITGIEQIWFAAGHSYDLTTNNANVAAGTEVFIRADALGAGDTLTFDGSAETDGEFSINGGAGDDVLTGGHMRDGFGLYAGGNDTIYGGDDNDAIFFGATFDNGDRVYGGAGDDFIQIGGDYSAGLTLGASTITGVESIIMEGGNNYALTLDNGNVASGQTLAIEGNALLFSTNWLTCDGSAVVDGKLALEGGGGNDVLIGGSNDDTITGNQGADLLTGGAGADTFSVAGYAGNSSSTGHDTITDFDASEDKFDLVSSVVAYDGQHTSTVAINNASFDSDLASASAGFITAYGAVVVNAGSHGGDLDGHTFLVVDANGDAAYTANIDYVFDITGATNLASLSTANFI